MEHRHLWQAVLGELEVSLSRANFATWFRHTSILSSEDGHVIIAVPNIFTKAYIEKRYHTDIRAALTKLQQGLRSVEYKVSTVEATTAPEPGEVAVTVPEPAQALGSSISSLNDRYTFDSFVVGASNDMAYAASQAVAREPGSKYNPLFIYGGVGLGKTHLVQAIGNEIRRRESAKRVEYVTSEGFTNDFLSALSRKKTDAFTTKYRQVDVLIVDDMQFLGGKERTQEEFFHTFNALHHANKQIIISSDKPPTAINGLEDRLKTRFAMGMMADIQAPDLETRAAILQTKAAAQNVLLPMEVVEYLAANIKSNIRELEGALTQLIAWAEFRGVEPSIATATGLLGSLAAAKPKLKPVTAKTVIERVAAFFDLSPAEITGLKRDKEIVVPRQITMYLLRQELGLSYPKIAAAVGGRDHTTAIHSVNKIAKQLEVDEMLRTELASLKERLSL